MPQRGKLFVKIWRARRCAARSRGRRGTGELAEIASSSGSTGRRRSHTATARSAPRTPTCTCSAEGVVAPGDVLEVLRHAAVVLGVDDLLLLPRAPRVGAGGGEQRALARGEREQPRARLALAPRRVGEALAPARADLDLGLDQLAGHRLARAPRPPVRRSRSSSKRWASDSVSGSRIWNSSSIPTVKSSEASKTSLHAVPCPASWGGSGQVEVERVEQVDGRARGVHRHLGRHLQAAPRSS